MANVPPYEFLDGDDFQLAANEERTLRVIDGPCDVFLFGATADAVEVSINNADWQKFNLKTGFQIPQGERADIRLRDTSGSTNTLQIQLGRFRFVDGTVDLSTNATAINADMRVGGADVSNANPVPIEDGGASLTVDTDDGALAVQQGGDETWSATDADGGGSTTIAAAPGAGLRNKVTWLHLHETTGNACTLTISDGTWSVVFDLTANEQKSIPIPGGLVAAVNTAITIACAGASASVDVVAAGVSE